MLSVLIYHMLVTRKLRKIPLKLVVPLRLIDTKVLPWFLFNFKLRNHKVRLKGFLIRNYCIFLKTKILRVIFLCIIMKIILKFLETILKPSLLYFFVGRKQVCLYYENSFCFQSEKQSMNLFKIYWFLMWSSNKNKKRIALWVQKTKEIENMISNWDFFSSWPSNCSRGKINSPIHGYHLRYLERKMNQR